MAQPFIGEVRLYPYSFAPRGWAFCNGQILPIAQNTALFSLLGTTYGGNGVSTYQLPDLRGRVPIGAGQGPGLSPRVLGEESGSETVTLLSSEMPAHTHTVGATVQAGAFSAPGPSEGLARSNGGLAYAAMAHMTPMHPQSIGVSGGNQPHTNLMPLLTLNFCIALNGVFPARN